jgi:hypothetical protein
MGDGRDISPLEKLIRFQAAFHAVKLRDSRVDPAVSVPVPYGIAPRDCEIRPHTLNRIEDALSALGSPSRLQKYVVLKTQDDKQTVLWHSNDFSRGLPGDIRLSRQSLDLTKGDRNGGDAGYGYAGVQADPW